MFDWVTTNHCAFDSKKMSTYLHHCYYKVTWNLMTFFSTDASVLLLLLDYHCQKCLSTNMILITEPDKVLLCHGALQSPLQINYQVGHSAVKCELPLHRILIWPPVILAWVPVHPAGYHAACLLQHMSILLTFIMYFCGNILNMLLLCVAYETCMSPLELLLHLK